MSISDFHRFVWPFAWPVNKIRTKIIIIAFLGIIKKKQLANLIRHQIVMGWDGKQHPLWFDNYRIYCVNRFLIAILAFLSVTNSKFSFVIGLAGCEGGGKGAMLMKYDCSFSTSLEQGLLLWKYGTSFLFVPNMWRTNKTIISSNFGKDDCPSNDGLSTRITLGWIDVRHFMIFKPLFSL